MGLVDRKREGTIPRTDELRLDHLREYLRRDPSYSAEHPAKHWAFVKIDPGRMRAIGEDPEEFAKFRDGFRNAIDPQDDFEDFLATQMVESRWRQFRLLKAEAAILAKGRCQFAVDRRRQLAGQGRSLEAPSGAPGNLPSAVGPEPKSGSIEAGGAEPRLQASGSRFATLVKFLRRVREAVQSEGFQGPSQRLLEGVAGPEGSATEALVAANYQHSQAELAEDPSRQEQCMKNFLTWLDAEITAFEGLARLDDEAEAELSAHTLDSLLLLPDKESEKIRRYEADRRRDFDRALSRLMEWRKMQAALAEQRRKVERERIADARQRAQDAQDGLHY